MRIRTATSAAVLVGTVLLIWAALSACGAASTDVGGTEAPENSPPLPSRSASAAAGSSRPSPVASPSAAVVVEPEPEPPLDRPSRKDPLRIYFGGDSLAGMPGVMLGILTQKNGLARVKADYVECSRLTYGDPVDWPARVRQQIDAGRWDVGVFMIGANDSGMPMLVGGKSVMYPKKAWLDEYGRRAKKIASIMLRGGVDRVYWVGMPVMPSSSESKKMRDLNEIFEAVARSSPDVVYVDSYDLLATKSGKHKASLRSGDGVHYTNDGAMVVAEAVWKALRRDWGGR